MMKISLNSLILLFMVMCGPFAPAFAQSLNITHLGTFDLSTGDVCDMASDASHSYVLASNDSYRLYCYDLADSLNPLQVSALDLARPQSNDYVRDIQVQGELLIIAFGSSFSLCDISNPYAPQEHARIESEMSIIGFALHGDQLYAVANNRVMHWDIADPQSPVELGDLAYPGASLMHIYQDTMFLWMDTGAYAVYDVSDPLEYSFIGESEPTIPGYLPSFREHYLFIYSSSLLNVYDLSDALNPLYLGYVVPATLLSWAAELILTEDRLCLVYPPNEDGYSACHIFSFSGDNALQMLDLRWLENVQSVHGDGRGKVAFCGDAEFYISDVLLNSDSAYITANPYRKVCADETNAYMYLSGFGLCSFSLDNPENGPAFRISLNSVDAMDLNADYLVTAHSYYDDHYNHHFGQAFSIWSPAEPDTLIRIASESIDNMHTPIRDLRICGDLLIITKGSEGMEIWDISDSANPVQSIVMPGNRLIYHCGVVHGSYLYCAVQDIDQGNRQLLQVWDISDPEALSFMGMLILGYSVYQIEIWHQRLFLRGDENTLRIYDISDPAQPAFSEMLYYDGEAPVSMRIYNNSLALLYPDRLALYKPLGAMNRLPQGIYPLQGQVHAMAFSGTDAIVTTSQSALLLDCQAAFDLTGNSGGEAIPSALQLNSHPNPFAASSTVSFALKRASDTSLKLYNIRGQEVNTLLHGTMPAGEHSVLWDGRDKRGNACPAGIYLLRCTTSEGSQTKRLIRLSK